MKWWHFDWSSLFLGAFAKLQNTTISFVMSVYSSVCRHRAPRFPLEGFDEISYLTIFQKPIEKIQISLKSDKNNGHFLSRQYIFLSHVSQFFLEWKMFEKKNCRENETHILYSIAFFFCKSSRLWDNAEKYCRARQATDNMAHAHYKLDT